MAAPLHLDQVAGGARHQSLANESVRRRREIATPRRIVSTVMVDPVSATMTVTSNAGR
jgi:hypothetical protein